MCSNMTSTPDSNREGVEAAALRHAAEGQAAATTDSRKKKKRKKHTHTNER